MNIPANLQAELAWLEAIEIDPTKKHSRTSVFRPKSDNIDVVQLGGTPSPDMFNAAAEEIEQLLERDTLSRFYSM